MTCPSSSTTRSAALEPFVGVASLGVAVLAARRPGVISVLAAAGAGWFGASHLVAGRTGYAGCPELGAIPSVVLGREVQVGCVPWRIADRRAGPQHMSYMQILYPRLREPLDQGAQLVEVLPPAEYDELHLPGAISIPLKTLDAESTATLDRARAVVVYCWDGL
jgi:hypothetical protein